MKTRYGLSPGSVEAIEAMLNSSKYYTADERGLVLMTMAPSLGEHGLPPGSIISWKRGIWA